MSDNFETAPTQSEGIENEQQRVEEALAVITENESTEQSAADEPEKMNKQTNPDATENDQPKENGEPQDQTHNQHAQPGAASNGESEDPIKKGDLGEEHKDELKQTQADQQECDQIKAVESGGNPTVLVETQEVVSSSTSNNQSQRKHSTGRSKVASRRASYQTSRSYAGGSFQNYGLTYLPYKSNFEPSEDARRRADEYFKSLKL